MMIKTADKAVFQNGNYDENGLLRWSDTPSTKGGMSLSAIHKWDVNGFTRVADPSNLFAGECVSLLKSAVGSGGHETTSAWGRGARVTEGGVAIGTPIATFSGSGGYAYDNLNEHAGIFAGYLINAGHITGFQMWSQNYTKPYLVSKHRIEQTGDGSVSDADAYYVIMVPE